MVVVRGVICLYFGPLIYYIDFLFHWFWSAHHLLKYSTDYFTEYNDRASCIFLLLNKSVNRCSVFDTNMARGDLSLLKHSKSYKDVEFKGWD